MREVLARRKGCMIRGKKARIISTRLRVWKAMAGCVSPGGASRGCLHDWQSRGAPGKISHNPNNEVLAYLRACCKSSNEVGT
jgi:hypothetical protein